MHILFVYVWLSRFYIVCMCCFTIKKERNKINNKNQINKKFITKNQKTFKLKSNRIQTIKQNEIKGKTPKSHLKPNSNTM